MESKELEEVLHALGRLVNNVELDTKYWHNKLEDDYKLVKKALQRLEQIDNANPSEALACLTTFDYIVAKCQEENNYIIKFPLGVQKGTTFVEEMQKAYKTIKQALIKAQEDKKKEQAFDIIEKKLVSIVDVYQCVDLYSYNSLVKGTTANGVPRELTQEEFDLLKEMLK